MLAGPSRAGREVWGGGGGGGGEGRREIKQICFGLIGERLLKNGRILLLDLYYLINT